MSKSAVMEILQKIDSVPQRDRLKLERELEARADNEGMPLARQARTKTRNAGITQSTIDRTVEQTRYGRR